MSFACETFGLAVRERHFVLFRLLGVRAYSQAETDDNARATYQVISVAFSSPLDPADAGYRAVLGLRPAPCLNYLAYLSVLFVSSSPLPRSACLYVSVHSGLL